MYIDHLKCRILSLWLWAKCLVIGCLATVVVSWTCAILLDVVDSDDHETLGRSHQTDRVLLISSRTFGSQMYGAVDAISVSSFSDYPAITADRNLLIPSWTRFRSIAHIPGRNEIRADIARGWPLLALSCSLDAAWVGDYSTGPIVVRYGIDLGRFRRGTHLSRRVLPCKPIWTGLAVDSGAFGALIAFLMLTAWTVRYKFRLGRSRCPLCNYMLQLLIPGCPECGWNRSELDKGIKLE